MFFPLQTNNMSNYYIISRNDYFHLQNDIMCEYFETLFAMMLQKDITMPFLLKISFKSSIIVIEFDVFLTVVIKLGFGSFSYKYHF